MKKIIFLTPIFFSLLNCELKVKSSSAYNNDIRLGRNVFGVGHKENLIQYNTIEINGMEYAVFGGANGTSSSHGVGVAVVNLTKEKLEIELLKKQLNK